MWLGHFERNRGGAEGTTLTIGVGYQQLAASDWLLLGIVHMWYGPLHKLPKWPVLTLGLVSFAFVTDHVWLLVCGRHTSRESGNHG